MTKPIQDMTNEEFFKFVIEDTMQGWIPMKTYLKLFPGETRAGIEARIARKVWKRGVHYNVPDKGRTWVCLTAIRQWVTDGGGD